ncbi:major facilitator superfamily domain-containing protein [Pseudomassariella vexata]|uniref:Major facilitator superfamily domain-containing protein n=1 Tax=Pseudomassariella vexata TaxID=1141098 RepID=A0A1Y2DQJ7_9PEZI|nr:major facilitator superfamily domain-containing protein [Pseudomassariella vexata]ORY61487.1 major facilitator superfamily domain-containing protein [Pseudomassariella vexata]
MAKSVGKGAVAQGSSSSADAAAALIAAPSETSDDTTTICGGDDDSSLQKHAEAEQVRWRDLPSKNQLFILSLCRLSEPLSNVCLLPYIFYLVRSVLPKSEDDSPDDAAARISEYSGLLVAAFPLAQFVVSLPWGRISDSHGRRISIIAGLVISVLANIGFGLSRSLGAFLFWRTLAGFANGNVGIMRTVTAEIVKERRFQTKAFLLLPLVFNSGMVASLALGGMLAEPVINLPWLFGPGGILNTIGNPDGVVWALTYPYALPALLNATLLTIALALAVLGLRETLPGKEGQSDIGLETGVVLRRFARRLLTARKSDYVAIRETDEILMDMTPVIEKPTTTINITDRRKTPFRDIWTRKVVCALVSFGLLPLHNSAFMHIFPVYLSSPPADNTEATFYAFTGGLGLRSATIGLWLSVFGICGILLQLFIYPRLQVRIGTRGVFRIALFLFPITYTAAPYLSLLTGDHEARWVFLGLIVCAQIMARTMAIPSTVILLTEAAPERSVLGTIHGAGNMLASLARAIGPAIGGYVFALGVEEGVVGLVWWLYLASVAVVAVVALAWPYLMDRKVEEHE